MIKMLGDVGYVKIDEERYGLTGELDRLIELREKLQAYVIGVNKRKYEEET